MATKEGRASFGWGPCVQDAAVLLGHAPPVDGVHETAAWCAEACVPDVLAKIDDLAAGQGRVEALLEGIQEDLSRLVAGRAQPEAAGEPVSKRSMSEAMGRTSSRRSFDISSRVSVQTAYAQEEGARAMTRELSSTTSRVCAEATEVHSSGDLPPSLPPTWPGCLDRRKNATIADRLARFRRTRKHEARSARRADSECGQLAWRGKSWMRHIMVDPNSRFHIVYSLISLLVLAHDLLIIPYMLAWELKLEGITLVTAWISCIFWTCDVGVNCVTGYTQGGRLEMRVYFIVRRYVRSWFALDLIVVLTDWMAMTLGAAELGSVPPTFTQVGKTLRLLSMLRMIRAVRIIQDIVESSLSNVARGAMRAFLVVSGVLWVNHVIGCLWFTIGRAAPSDTGMRWVESTRTWEGQDVQFLHHDLSHQYIASLHWSMAQFTLGAMDVSAFNSFERIYTIMCMSLGLIFGSTLVSLLSASMVDYQMTSNDQIQRIRKLRCFLKENNISRSTAALVQQQAQERLSMQAKIQEEDVQALQLLSTNLRTTLRFERFKDHLCKHAFFRLWMDMDLGLVRSLCTDAMQCIMIRPHDDLFVPGATTDTAYNVLSGEMVYVQEPMTAPVEVTRVTTVALGQWICEAALWAHWVHVGTATARSPCQVLTMSGDALMTVLAKHSRHAALAEVITEYARAFHRRLRGACPPMGYWPNDLEVPDTDYGDLVLTMDHDAQATISLQACEHLRIASQGGHHSRATTSTTPGEFRRNSTGNVKNGAIPRLKEEVSKGISCVMVNADGQVERVVCVIALWLQNEDGQVMVELGKKQGQEPIKAVGKLPGVKQEGGEQPEATLARLLARFHLELSELEPGRVVREVEWKPSADYGVRTKYIRAKHHLTLRDDLEIPCHSMDSATKPPRPASIHSVTSNPSMKSLKSDWKKADVYVIPNGEDKWTYYSWLDPARFDYLQTPPGERELQHFIAFLTRQKLEEFAAL